MRGFIKLAHNLSEMLATQYLTASDVSLQDQFIFPSIFALYLIFNICTYLIFVIYFICMYVKHSTAGATKHELENLSLEI